MDDDSTIDSLANALLGKEEEIKPDEKPAEEDKGQEQAKPDAEAEAEAEKSEDEEKKPEDEKPADDTKPGDDKPADTSKPEDEQSEPAKETPLTREDIRQAMREEQEAREAVSSERTSFAGKVRSDLKESLKLDSTYTDITLDDGTPITSVTQLTQVINPETEEPYTREEASTLLLDARRIIGDNLKAYEERVDALTDLNVDFKEQADEVDRIYGNILKAFPEEAKGWLAAYQKTFKMSEDGSYVTDVPISPLEFYAPIVKPFLNASAQVAQQQEEAKAAEEKAVKDAEIKAEQEDRGDLGGTAGAAQGKPNLLVDALTAYGKDN